MRGGLMRRNAREALMMSLLTPFLAVAVGCSSPNQSASVDVETTGSPTSLTTVDPVEARAGDLVEVFIDPRDDTHLLLRLAFCVEDASASAVETVTEVAISVASRPIDPPCEQDLVDLHLEAPLISRHVIDAAHDIEMMVQTASFLYPDTADLAPAECTADAARAAVAKDVDGGLRSEMLACDGNWMAVDTSTNACPATGDSIAEGCIANQHIAYFHNDDGYWTIVAFDCDLVRSSHPDFPAEICQE